MRPDFKNKAFFIKLSNWEYWPFYLVYIPIFLYWVYLGIKARSVLFFSAANPAIESGGMLGESKFNILEMLPGEFKPKTIFIHKDYSEGKILQLIKANGINFPLIAKPDIGERGWMVEKLDNPEQLKKYINDAYFHFIIQDFIAHPLEFAIMYYRYPEEGKGIVNSVTIKEFLSVTGDGKSTVKELLNKNPRAILQIPVLNDVLGSELNNVVKKGEKRELMPIGNHCRGTKFINGNHLIDTKLMEAFDDINKTTPGIFFCRYDLKCTSIEDLKNGKNIKIMEINGVGSEPAHIYDPGFKLMDAYKALFNQWKTIYEISRINRKKGITYMTVKEATQTIRFLLNYKKKAA
ncbi:MAG: hypothetical protein GXO89_03815 [Chlorobi bacterium]|nr:hypothetical protein [Chlorobiota bacterium]